ncbi:acyl-CoA dehydrogenase family protein [Arthrobacter antibioticus]|uniref:acyl-CoA dehydrogenase family protein n=1 Tax=Arthrobacter sp. H35-MC1 TaxID=3046203 RepID=UPI0024BB31E1|nr:acyl-CoA dehydrogenase [Arthrobacter sp. H35-MC1]MDJ0318680.1 acyl-CoA dehydrogenase [Arthrobacter sp. H35-MC1]
MTTTMTNTRWSGFIEAFGATGNDHAEHRSDGLAVDMWEQLSESGVFATFAEADTEHAGLKTAVSRMRELGRTSPDRGLTFSAVTQLASTIYCLRAFADRGIQERYLPEAETGTAISGHAITEAEAGSDVMNMSTTATRHGDHYVLTGTKRFITNAPVASTLVVYAKTVEEDGSDKGLSAFLVETSWHGMDTTGVMPTAGLRTSPIGTVSMDHVKVPAGNRIGHIGAGLLILDQVMKRETLLAFAANLGEMEQVVADAVRYVNQRKQFGVTIGSNQLVANRIVETQVAIELGGALLNSIADRLDGFEDVTIPIAAAKIFISEANVQSVINALQVHGGNGYLRTSPLATHLLDAVPGAIYSGSNDLLRTKIATMLGVAT